MQTNETAITAQTDIATKRKMVVSAKIGLVVLVIWLVSLISCLVLFNVEATENFWEDNEDMGDVMAIITLFVLPSIIGIAGLFTGLQKNRPVIGILSLLLTPIGFIIALTAENRHKTSQREKSYGRRTRYVALSLFTILTAIAAMFFLRKPSTDAVFYRWKPATPAEKFHVEMNEKLDELISALREFRPGTVTGVAQMNGQGETIAGTTQLPRSFVVASRLEAVHYHFLRIDDATLQALFETKTIEPKRLQQLQQDFNDRIGTIKMQVERVKQMVQSSPAEYKEPFYVMGKPILPAYETVVFNGNDAVFMTQPRKGVRVSIVLNFDINGFIQSLETRHPATQPRNQEQD